QGEPWVGGNEPGLARVLQIEMLDDDARLWNRAVAVLQHGKLAAGPKFLEHRGVGRIHQIDDAALERRVIFIERDQRFMTERRKRMEVEGKGHTLALGFGYDAVDWVMPRRSS